MSNLKNNIQKFLENKNTHPVYITGFYNGMNPVVLLPGIYVIQSDNDIVTKDFMIQLAQYMAELEYNISLHLQETTMNEFISKMLCQYNYKVYNGTATALDFYKKSQDVNKSLLNGIKTIANRIEVYSNTPYVNNNYTYPNVIFIENWDKFTIKNTILSTYSSNANRLILIFSSKNTDYTDNIIKLSLEKKIENKIIYSIKCTPKYSDEYTSNLSLELEYNHKYGIFI